MGKKHFTDKSKNWEEVLSSIKYQIQEGEFGKINCLIVYKKEKKLIEAYFNGYDATTSHEFQSVTKSIQAILIGLAVQYKMLPHIAVPIKSFFPELKHLDWHGGKDKITIRHLMQMTAGLEWNEGKTSYTSFQNHSNQLAWSKDWITFALNMPMRANPGEKFNYSSANPIIISAIINKIFDGGHESFVKKYLFNPLGIIQYSYHRSVDYPTILADIEMLPKDMVKIGRLIQQKGIWNGEQLVFTNWIDQMLQDTIATNNVSLRYGYFWWHTLLKVAAEHFTINYAWGYGSQHIFIVREIDLVMVCTGKNYEVNIHEGPFKILKQLLETILTYK